MPAYLRYVEQHCNDKLQMKINHSRKAPICEENFEANKLAIIYSHLSIPRHNKISASLRKGLSDAFKKRKPYLKCLLRLTFLKISQ